MHHRATELHVVSAFYPVECVAVVPIMPVPHAITGVLRVHIQGAQAAEVGVGEFDPRWNAGDRVRHPLSLPEPPVEEVAKVKLIDQIGPDRTGQTGYNIAWKSRIARNGLGNAELVAGQ